MTKPGSFYFKAAKLFNNPFTNTQPFKWNLFNQYKPVFYLRLASWYTKAFKNGPFPFQKATKRVLPYTPLVRGFCSTPSNMENSSKGKAVSSHSSSTTQLIVSSTPEKVGFRRRLRRLLMRNKRPWTLDDVLAMFSWVLLSHSFFVLVGTTTFFSLVLAVANSLKFQEFVRDSLGKIITKEIGMHVTFESAIVPNWKDGRITFKKVLLQYNTPNVQNTDSASTDTPVVWDLKFDSIDITLSLVRYLDGKGIVKDCVLKGVRGIIDRSKVTYNSSDVYDPETERFVHRLNDFELESLLIEDLLLTVCYPDNFRPFQVSIFNAHLPILRKRWFFYDMICANSLVGMFDNCLFSVHMSQNNSSVSDPSGQIPFRRSHFRVDGVPIDQFNGGAEGPFGWITSGTVDFDVDIIIPNCNEEDVFKKFANEIRTKFDETVINSLGTLSEEIPQNFPSIAELLNNATIKARSASSDLMRVQKRLDSIHSPDSLVFDVDLRFNNIRTGIPITTGEFTLASQTVIRPVVAFMNSNRTCIPVHCRVISNLTKFDGAWTVHDSEFAVDLSKELNSELINLVHDERERNRRLKRVGLWGLQSITRNIITIIEYSRGIRGFWHYIGSVPDLKELS